MQAGIAVSLVSRDDAYDNAVAETFFATPKKCLVTGPGCHENRGRTTLSRPKR